MAGWSTLTGGVIAVGVGTGAAAALEPVMEPQRQAAWEASKAKLLALGDLARLVSQGLLELSEAQAEAGRLGFAPSRVAARVQLELHAPPVAELLELWRRGKITEEQVNRGLAKAQLEPGYWEPLRELFYGRLDPSVVAVAIQRGIMAAPFTLPVAPPTGGVKVKAFPRSSLDPVEEVKASGIDVDRLFVETAIQGRPMSPEAAAVAAFRGIIARQDYDLAIAEGNVRNEWGPPIFEASRQIPSTTNYVEGRLRAWLTTPEMHDGVARHGMTPEDADLLLKIHGRPLSWHQVWIGIQRGGVYDGPVDMIHPAFLKALQESDIRPEWYNLAWHQRFSYPSPFVLRSMTTAGDITQPEAEQILLYIGWEPSLAAKVSRRWAGGTTATGKQETKTELEDEYAGGYLTEAELRTALEQLGYQGAALDLLVHLNDARRIKKWREKVVDAIASSYLAGKVDAATATSELAEVNVLGEAATLLLGLWDKQARALAA